MPTLNFIISAIDIIRNKEIELEKIWEYFFVSMVCVDIWSFFILIPEHVNVLYWIHHTTQFCGFCVQVSVINQ